MTILHAGDEIAVKMAKGRKVPNASLIEVEILQEKEKNHRVKA